MQLLKTLILGFVSFTALEAQISVNATVTHLNSAATPSVGSISLDVSGGVSPYSYLWSPGSFTTQTVSDLVKNTYSVKVTDTNADTAIYNYDIGYKVEWDNLVGNGYFRNDSISGVFASSKNTLLPNEDGWVEFVQHSFPGSYYYIGFVDSLSPSNSGVGDFNYAALSYNGIIYDYETGNSGYIGSIQDGDVVRIERVGDTINYRVNGVVGRTLFAAGISQKTLKLKCFINNVSLALVNVGCSFIHMDSVAFKNYVKVSPVIIHSSGPGITNGSAALHPNYPGAYTYSWSPGGAATSSITSLGFGSYSVTVSDSLANQSPYNYNVGYKVQWDNVLGGGYFRNDSIISAVASSKNTLLPNEDGWVEFVQSNDPGYYYMGFTDSLSPIYYDAADIDYGVISSNGYLYYEESGSVTVIGYPVPGDLIRIERTGDTINYKINGIVVRAINATGMSQKTFKLKCNVYGFLANVGCSFIHMDSVAFKNYVKVSPVIIHSSGPGITNGSAALHPNYPGAYTYSWSPGGAATSSITSLGFGTYSVTVKDSLANQSPYNYNVGYKVQWDNVLGGGYFRNDSIISAVASSKNTLLPNEDGWVEFVQSNDPGYYYMGFTDSLSPIYYDAADIDYGVISSNGYLYYEESGSVTVIGYPVPGDLIRIERTGDTINYRINGSVVRTINATGMSQKTFKLKCNVYGFLANVGCNFMHTDSVTFDNYVTVHPIIKHVSKPGLNDGSVTVIPDHGATDTYSWSPSGVTTSSLTGLGIGTYSVSVSDSSSNKSSYAYNVGYKVQWYNVLGGGYSRNDSISEAGFASSKNTLLPGEDGWVEYAAPYAPGYYYLGFTDSISPIYLVSDIDYGVLYVGNMYYYETDQDGIMYSPKEGDIIRIERIGDTVNYRLNGVIQRSVSAPGISQKTFKLTCELGSSIILSNVGCSFMHTDSVTFDNYVRARPVIKHSSHYGAADGSINVVPLDSGLHTYSWSGGALTSSITALNFGTYHVNVSDSVQNQSPYSYHVGYKVIWDSLTPGGYFRNDTLGSNTNAQSKNVLAANTDGWIEYVEDTPLGSYFIGFADSISPGYDPADMDYGFYLYAGAYFYYYENGVITYAGLGPDMGDVLRLERVGDTISYSVKGNMLRSLTVPGISAKKLKLMALTGYNTLANVGCSFSENSGLPLSVKIAKTHAADDNLYSGIIAIAPAGGYPPYTYHMQDSVAVKNVQTGLYPGNYKITVTDSQNDTLHISTSIGLKNNWRIQKNISYINDIYTSSSTNTTSAGVLVSHNIIPPSTVGFCELTVTDSTNNTAFGFLGFSGPAVNTVNYTSPVINSGAIDTLLVYADSLIMSGKIDAAPSHKTQDAYAKLNLVYFLNDTVKIGFKNYTTVDTNAITYKAGDVFNIERNKGAVYLYKNDALVATGTTTGIEDQYLLNGIFVARNSSGIKYSASLAQHPDFNIFAGIPIFICTGEPVLNTVRTRTFDEYGNIKSDSKTYMDLIGRTIQSQTRVLSKENVLVTEPLYDSYGRAVGQSLQAPSYNTDICYVPHFIERSPGVSYTDTDFDYELGTGPIPIDNFNAIGDVNNAKPVNQATQGKLGWYYSSSNTSEPLVAADNLPYARTELYPDGRTRRSAGAGKNLKMGSGHENRFIYTSTLPVSTNPANNELNYVFPFRTYELQKDFTVQADHVNLNLQLFKTISINADGKDQITYTNSGGQTIATCVTGDGSGCVTHSDVKTLYPVINQEKIQNIYVPKTTAGTLRFLEVDAQQMPVSSPTSAVPVIKDIMSNTTLTSGTDYTFNATTGYFTFLGTYAGKSLYLQFTYTASSPPANQLIVSVDVDYTQWTLYFYDRKGRLLANAAPNDVICQTLPTALQRTSVSGKPQSTCTGGRVAGIKMNSSVTTHTAAVTAFINITQKADTVKTLNNPVPTNAFVLKSQAQKNYEDSVYIANDTLMSDTATVVNLADTALRLINLGMPSDDEVAFNRILDSVETQIPVNALRGKQITYSGNYGVYARMKGLPTLGALLATIPYNFTVESDTEPADSTGSAHLIIVPHNPLGPVIVPIDNPYGFDSLIIKLENPKINIYAFDSDNNTDPDFCSGSVFVPGIFNPGLSGLNQAVGPAINMAISNIPSLLNIKLANKYMYDEYDRLVESTSDDEGVVDYVYDQLEDKLMFTQNDKQRANSGRFSCIVYDALGRPIVTGEYKGTSGSTTPFQFQNYYDYKNGVAVTSGHISTGNAAAVSSSAYNDGRITDPTYMEYDNADAALPVNVGNSYYSQKYTAGKISKTYNTQSTTWYGYDELGRQLWSVHNSAELGYKTMTYAYNLRGNLLASAYQLLQPESMVHSYTYDADDRLSTASYAVATTGGPAPTVKPLANYNYYLHGPLKRTVLGNNLQGLDYVYTIDGKLKSVNNPLAANTSEDPGLDGYATGPNAAVSPDAFGYAMEYYSGDYDRSGSPIHSYNYTSAYNDDNTSYTGLVKAMSWRTALPAAATANYSNALMYEYNYDELYRLNGAQFGTVTETAPTLAHPIRYNTFTQLPEYNLGNIGYDQNGNLQSLKRYAAHIPSSSTAHLLDDLTYNYSSTQKNSLQQISDAAVNTAGYTADLDLPTQTASANYVYNEIGELTANTQENKGFEYNASGLTTKVYNITTNANIVTFTYNDKGLRHCKTSFNGSGTAVKATYYFYDAGCMQVATFTKDLVTSGAATQLQDYTLYGAGRVGTYEAASANALYELTDHLGNTRAVIKDNGSGVAETVSYTDFYPHGSVMPGQSYSSSLYFPYAYQGQEKDPETGLLNFELRQYDARIGRWYNPDPMGQHHSPYLAMGNNPVSSIDADGGWDGDDAYRDYQNSHSTTQNSGDSWINNMDAKESYQIDMHAYNEYRADHYNSSLGEWGDYKTGNVQTTYGAEMSETVFIADPTKKKSRPSLANHQLLDNGVNLSSLKVNKFSYENSPWYRTRIDTWGSNALRSSWNEAVSSVETVINLFAPSGRKDIFNGIDNTVINTIGWFATTNNDQKIDDIKENGVGISEDIAGGIALGYGVSRLGGIGIKPEVIKPQVKIHGNSLNSPKPTWGYKLYTDEGAYLKKGITSKAIPETRYTKSFMKGKVMKETTLFPNRRSAYEWEAIQERGPLNFNNH